MINNLLIFGGGLLQISIISLAKETGFNTIVIDVDPNAPGREIANQFYVVAGDDFERTHDIAKKYNVKGIVTSATDKPILMMCKIAKELKLPFPSFKSCDTLLDKYKFKEFLRSNNLPHAKGILVKGNNLPNQIDISCPLIVKPVMNSGSRGVIKVENLEELPKAIAETLKHSKDERFLIEEYVEGDEISIEALVQHGIVHLVQITDKIVSEPPYNVELGHIQPSKYLYLKEKIKDILQIIVDKTGLNNCALHSEFKIKEDNIKIIEIGPRLGGDFITSDLVKISTSVNIEKLLIDIATGQEIEILAKNLASIVSFFSFTDGLILKNELEIDELKANFPNVMNVQFDLKKCEKIPIISNSLDRYGSVILKGFSYEQLIVDIQRIESYLRKKLF